MRPPPAPRLASLGALLLAAGCGGREGPPPDIALAGAPDTIQTTLFEATAGAWLGGDRWAVLSPADRRVVILDFSDRSLADLSGKEITVLVGLGLGAGAATVLSTDLSHAYVEENSAYSS